MSQKQAYNFENKQGSGFVINRQQKSKFKLFFKLQSAKIIVIMFNHFTVRYQLDITVMHSIGREYETIC